MARPADPIWLGWPELSSPTTIVDQADNPLNMPIDSLGSPPLPVVEARTGYDALKYDGDNGLAGAAWLGSLLGGKLDLSRGRTATLEFWVEFQPIETTDPRIFGWTDGNGAPSQFFGGMYIMMMGGFFNGDSYMRVRLGSFSQGGADLTHVLGTGTGPLTGQPRHLVITIDYQVNPQVIFYYEGSQVYTDSPFTTMNTFPDFNSNHRFMYGAAWNGNNERRHWHGDCAKGSAYNRALSAQDVSDLFALGPQPEGAPTFQPAWAMAGRGVMP